MTARQPRRSAGQQWRERISPPHVFRHGLPRSPAPLPDSLPAWWGHALEPQLATRQTQKPRSHTASSGAADWPQAVD